MRKPVSIIAELKKILVSMTEYQISSRAIRGMLALTFLAVAQIFSLFVMNALRKRLIKRLTWKNIAKMYRMALRMAFEVAGNCLKRQ